eukprot:6035566-Pleurochrysis_carterae.AAC.2
MSERDKCKLMKLLLTLKPWMKHAGKKISWVKIIPLTLLYPLLALSSFSLAIPTRRHAALFSSPSLAPARSGLTFMFEYLSPRVNLCPCSLPTEPGTCCHEHREYLGAVLLDGKLYIVGGRDGHTCLSSVERFDPRTSSWAPIPPMERKRSHLGTCIHRFKAVVHEKSAVVVIDAQLVSD